MHRPIYTGHELTYVSGHVCCCCFFFFFFHLKDSQCLLQSSWIGKSIFFPAANELGGPSVWPGLSSAGLLPGQGLACSTEILLGTETGSQGVIHGIVWDPLGSKKCAKGFGENWIGSQSQSGRRAVSAGAASLEVDTRGRYWVSLSLQKSRAVMGLLGTTSTRKWLKGHLRWCWWSWLQAEPCWCPCPQDLPEQLTVHSIHLPGHVSWKWTLPTFMASGKLGTCSENMRFDDHMQFSLIYIHCPNLSTLLSEVSHLSIHIFLYLHSCPSLTFFTSNSNPPFNGAFKVSEPAITWPPLYLIPSWSYMEKERN